MDHRWYPDDIGSRLKLSLGKTSRVRTLFDDVVILITFSRWPVLLFQIKLDHGPVGRKRSLVLIDQQVLKVLRTFFREFDGGLRAGDFGGDIVQRLDIVCEGRQSGAGIESRDHVPDEFAQHPNGALGCQNAFQDRAETSPRLETSDPPFLVFESEAAPIILGPELAALSVRRFGWPARMFWIVDTGFHHVAGFVVG